MEYTGAGREEKYILLPTEKQIKHEKMMYKAIPTLEVTTKFY